MNMIDRLNKLASLIEAAGGKIRTRKAFHKTVYLLQQAGEDFDQSYQYHHYGVFSPTLAADADYARLFDLVDEETDQEQGFTLSLKDWDANTSRVTFSKEVADLIKELTSRKPMLLEALSTVVYLSNNYYSGKELEAKLLELKPNLKKHFTEAFKLAQEHYKVDV